ncbi:MAG TPA: amino acid adenylation domain-containing protein [Candidatus Dormibacteraeota bacterium]
MTATSSAGLSAAKRALLEQRLRGIQHGDEPAAPSAPAAPRDGLIPLSAAQEQLWYFSQLAPGSALYNEAVSIRKQGALDLDVFRAAFNQVVERHQMWRSTFRVVDGRPYQTVGAPSDFALPLVDLSHLRPDQAEARAVGLAVAEARRPYDLDQGPLLRPLLVRLSAEDHRLYLAMHHLIFDGVSLYRVILPELVTLYQAGVAGRPARLAAPSWQYSDYVQSESVAQAAASSASALQYWRQRLAEIPEAQLPLDHARPARPRFAGRTEALTIPAETVARLDSFGRSVGSTLFQTLAAAFSLLLARYTGQEDLVFGTVTDLRDRRELESMVGYCLTPLVIRNDLQGDPSYRELLCRTRTSVLEALDHKIPFQRLVSELRPAREAGANPIFQAMLVLEPPMVTPDPEWSLHQMEAEIGNQLAKAKFDLHIELDRRPDGHLSGRLIYDSDLFEASTARGMAESWVRLLEELARDPERRLSQVSLQAPEELTRQLVTWNATTAEGPDMAVHEIVSLQARLRPDRVAVSCGSERLTYGELDARAAVLANALMADGRGVGSVVGLLAERSVDMVVGMLGILKAGAAYLPLDPRYPAERLSFILADSAAEAVVVAQRELAGVLPPGHPPVLWLGDLARGVGQLAGAIQGSQTPGTAAAYLLYTSGSTGKPKGVRVTHANVVNLIVALSRVPGITGEDRVLGVASYSFDMSVADFWVTLGLGASLELAPREAVGDGSELARLIESSRPTLMQATPTTWQMLVESGWRGAPGLRALVGGEALTGPLAQELLARVGEVWNMYGPTETTVWSAAGRVTGSDPISVGRPLANTRIYIVDAAMHPVLPGVTGEVLIGGAGVAMEYVNQAELTRRSFVPSPFLAGDRLYRTGDRGRFLPDGRIQLVGRADAQVKIRGFRVELGEVEACLAEHPRVLSAAVVAMGGEGRPTALAAYIVAADEAPPAGELRAFLHERLPNYMVPSYWTVLDRLPLTPSGKVDRQRLPEPTLASRTEPVPARLASDLEERLLKIWSRHLGTDELGLDDDFFEVGGHSLLAVRLMVDVEREVGGKLRLDSMFERGASVAGMAAVIEASRAGVDGGDPVGAGHVPGAPNLFFVQPDESTMLTLRHFTGSLASRYRVVGLLPDRVAGRFDRTRRIEDLATPMVDTIRRQQPQGPYYIAGFSLGGLLAYEVAARLGETGERVAWLGILDCAGDPAIFQRLLWRHSVVGRLAGLFHRTSRRELITQVTALARRTLRAPGVRVGLFPPPVRDDFDWRGAMALGSRYQPPAADLPLELFVSANSVEMMGSETLGWEKIHQRPLTSHVIPGDHLAMVTEPQVRLVVDLLTSSLGGLQIAGAAPSA